MSPLPTHDALRDAIREAYEGRGLTQVQVAERMAVDQTRISRLANGKWSEDRGPDPWILAKIEDAAGRPRGWILTQAGFVAEARTVPDAIAVDPALSDTQRGFLLTFYRGAVQELEQVGRRRGKARYVRPKS